MSPRDKISIAIASDEPERRQRIKHWLEHLGYDSVESTANGDEVLDLARDTSLDLLVLTRYLGDIACRTLVRKLRGLPSIDRLPVLMITDPVTQESLLEILDCGVDDVLIYPCSVDTLDKKLNGLLNTRQP